MENEKPSGSARMKLVELQLEDARAHVRMLRDAIGVCVPAALRCFIDVSRRDGMTIDVEITEKVLLRVEAAMKATQ